MTVVRPTFLDGGILAAQDLTALESTARDRAARHARHLHTPGVAEGLALTGTKGSTAAGQSYVDVTLTAGYAVDGTGRELVLDADQQLSPDRFTADNPDPQPDPDDPQPTSGSTPWHPVFVVGVDGALAGAAARGSCAHAPGGGGVEELLDVVFGLPGDSDRDQVPPPAAAGQGTGAWRVLVGYVKYDVDLDRFSDVSPDAGGQSVTGAGARASLVAGTGRVELRAGGSPAAGTTALLVDGSGGGTLTFGAYGGSGAISPLLTVDKAGNVKAKGTITGVQTVGSVRVATGVVSDGTVVPLPDGVDQAAVDAGELVASVLVTPLLPDPATAPNATSVFVHQVCEVDADRRVSCRGVWFDSTSAVAPVSVAASCRFLVLVTVAEGGP
jgi:hypothetical protein